MNRSDETAPTAPATPRPVSRIALTAISVGLAMSVTVNVLLAHRVRTLTYAKAARISEYQLKIGTTVPPIKVKRLGGQQEVISYQDTDRPTVLYIFTPPCTWCARNMDNFKALVNSESNKYRFMGLSLSEEGLAQYIAKNQLKLPIYSGLSTESGNAYKLAGTPQTIVVSPEGRVLQNWMGAYVGDQKSQVEAFFHVDLPGIRELPEAKAAKN